MPDTTAMIAETNANVKHIKLRIDKINGHVEEHEARIREVELGQENIRGNCRVEQGAMKTVSDDIETLFKRTSPVKIVLLIVAVQSLVGVGTVLALTKLIN